MYMRTKENDNINYSYLLFSQQSNSVNNQFAVALKSTWAIYK